MKATALLPSREGGAILTTPGMESALLRHKFLPDLANAHWLVRMRPGSRLGIQQIVEFGRHAYAKRSDRHPRGRSLDLPHPDICEFSCHGQRFDSDLRPLHAWVVSGRNRRCEWRLMPCSTPTRTGLFQTDADRIPAPTGDRSVRPCLGDIEQGIPAGATLDISSTAIYTSFLSPQSV